MDVLRREGRGDSKDRKDNEDIGGWGGRCAAPRPCVTSTRRRAQNATPVRIPLAPAHNRWCVRRACCAALSATVGRGLLLETVLRHRPCAIGTSSLALMETAPDFAVSCGANPHRVSRTRQLVTRWWTCRNGYKYHASDHRTPSPPSPPCTTVFHHRSVKSLNLTHWMWGPSQLSRRLPMVT